MPPTDRERGDMEQNPNLFDSMSQWFETLAQKTRYEERNRLTLLGIHATMGVLIGALIIADGGPQVAQYLNVDHVSLGLPAFVGGSLLWVGLLANRNLRLEAFGMTLMLIWDLFMCGLFVVAALGGAPAYSASLYPIALYGGMAALMSVHLWTLLTFISGGGHARND